MLIKEWEQEKCVPTTDLSNVRNAGSLPQVNTSGNALKANDAPASPPPGGFEDDWAARHNDELWLNGPDGTWSWRDQADGCFK
jgi:hypothetical protein